MSDIMRLPEYPFACAIIPYTNSRKSQEKIKKKSGKSQNGKFIKADISLRRCSNTNCSSRYKLPKIHAMFNICTCMGLSLGLINSSSTVCIKAIKKSWPINMVNSRILHLQRGLYYVYVKELCLRI
jgi:hypothetical protein